VSDKAPTAWTFGLPFGATVRIRIRIRIRINEQVKLLLKAFNITGHHRCISHAPTSAHS